MSSISMVKQSFCTGCSACFFVCPLKCISLVKDAEGFLVPRIGSSQCINCSECTGHCSACQKTDLSSPVMSYIARADFERIRSSSSGGIAYALARLFIENGGIVIACAFNEVGVAKHRVFSSVNELWHIQGSKYVQSDSIHSYEICKKYLEKGCRVLYIGTPCQIAAVKLVFQGYSRLYTVDLICHGVPSPELWKKNLAFLNTKRKLLEKETIMFRSSNSRGRTNFELYDASSGRAIPYEFDAFFSLFLRGASFRESCYTCSFARKERAGDLTIGDCGSRDLYPDFYPSKSVSSVLVNSSVGLLMFEELLLGKRIDAIPIDLDKEVQANEQLHMPFNRPQIRDRVYKDLNILSYEDYSRRYRQKVSLFWWVKRTVKRLLPVELRVVIRKMLRRISFHG